MSNIRTDRTDFSPELLNSWGRLRVGYPSDVLDVDSVLKYGIEPGYLTSTTGTASATFLSDQSSYELSVGTDSGDKVIRETNRAQNYNPGRGTHVIQTGTFGPQKTGVVSRIGFFNEENGLFFQRDENDISAAIRSNTTGTPVDQATTQANWNVDRLDGTGPSGITLNPDNMQMFIIDFQWLGAGQVRFGFHVTGNFVIVHEQDSANNVTEPYMSRASLPLRFELENVASTSSSSIMKMTGSAMITEGSADGRITYPQSENTGFTEVTVPEGEWTPLMSFSMSEIVNTVPVTGYAILRRLNILNDADTIALFQIVQNATLTGDSFTSHSPESLVMVDASATDATNGFVAYQQYVGRSAGNNSVGRVQDTDQQDLTLYPGDTYTIRARSMTTTSAALFLAVNWFEVY